MCNNVRGIRDRGGVATYYVKISSVAASRSPVVRDQKIDDEKGTLKITRSYSLINVAINYGVTNT